MYLVSNQRKIFNIFNSVLFAIAALIVIIPFMNVLAVSFSKEADVIKSTYMLIPPRFTLEAYIQVFSTKTLYGAIFNGLKLVLIAAPSTILCTTMAAYVLMYKKMFGVKLLSQLIIIAMVFDPGVVPTYILLKDLGLVGKYTGLVFLGLINSWNIIYVKNFFYTIPSSLPESARIDGASELRIFRVIVLPLVKPIIAVLALWNIIGNWNAYTPFLFYIPDPAKWPLQPVLREIVLNNNSQMQDSTVSGTIFGKNVAMVCMVISAIPVLIIYPYIQKYFMRGIMLGAVKG